MTGHGSCFCPSIRPAAPGLFEVFLDFLVCHSQCSFPCLDAFLHLHQLLDLGLDALGFLVDPILLRLYLLRSVVRPLEFLLVPFELLLQQLSASKYRLFVAHHRQRFLQDVDFLLS